MKKIILGAVLGIASSLLFVVIALILVGSPPATDPQGLHTTGVLHVNLNVTDFDRSKIFYEKLGFTHLMDVNKSAIGDVAAAVGTDSYVVKGALMAHKDGSVIDLLEWQKPRDVQPPYDNLFRPGLARLAMTTTDLDADVARLKKDGVVFISDRPGKVSDGLGGTTRFICFKDPDGTILELVEMGPLMGVIQGAVQKQKADAR
ncbi:MAG: VOC family protein [Deltaproteobacteria bacterium]|nr:VOC family protein [Deltaproteobacteria bacterium]